jgi:hypothetical protein
VSFNVEEQLSNMTASVFAVNLASENYYEAIEAMET